MGKRDTKEARREALKLAEEIGPAAAARPAGHQHGHAVRLAWAGERAHRRTGGGGRSEAELLAANKELREQLKQAQQDMGIFQEALGLV